jgi:hypothetical protein
MGSTAARKAKVKKLLALSLLLITRYSLLITRYLLILTPNSRSVLVEIDGFVITATLAGSFGIDCTTENF